VYNGFVKGNITQVVTFISINLYILLTNLRKRRIQKKRQWRRKMNKQKTKNLSFMSLFIAIEILMVMVPFLGFIPIGPLRATTLHIPVIIAGIVLGKKQGAGIGLVFGISSLVINTIQPTLTSFVFSPFISKSLMSAFIAIVPRVLIGYIAGLLFEKLKDKNEFMAMIVGSFLGAMTNTVLVLGGIYFIFGSQYASAIGKDLSALFPYLIGIITTSGLLEAIVGTDSRVDVVVKDFIAHYDLRQQAINGKVMFVAMSRKIAVKLYSKIIEYRPEWHSDDVDKGTIKVIMTSAASDPPEFQPHSTTASQKKLLAKRMKDVEDELKIVIVCDMWLTGFDVPCLHTMYVDKPMSGHNLMQAIARVNRVFKDKPGGLIVDYIGIKNDMMEAIKKYGGPQESPVDELDITIGIFRNHLKMIDDLLLGFNASKFFTGEPLERLNCLNSAAEYVQSRKDTERRFMGLSRRLKSAYNICFPSGELTDEETAKAQFYLAIRSIIYKQTKGNAPDAEAMNQVVENMVREAIACTGIENVVDEHKSVDLFSDEFIEQLNTVKLPITKFNALLKLLRKAISAYGRTNKVKAMEFDERLRKVVDDYNSRDKLVFTNEVVSDFVNDLSDQLLQILRDLQEDQSSFQKMGISFEEKAFYDILVKVRDDHGFPYADEKCVVLAKKIKELVDDKAQFADWSTRDDIKNQLNMELTVLLYQNGYPPEWDEEVFEKVMEQAENFKKYAD